MSRWLSFPRILLIVSLVISCGNKRTTDEPVGEPEKLSDFIRIFPEVSLPWTASDSIMNRKEKDSTLISRQIFERFVPDSVLGSFHAKNTKVKISPLGRVDAGTETYLFTKTSSPGKTGLWVIAFDNKEEFAGAVSFSKPASSSLSQTVTMDRKFTITRALTRRNSDGSFSEGKDVFVLNAAIKDFSLIMTEALDDKSTELINPIDTLSRKHKWAADYSNGKMNLVSIRDGRREGRLSFYIHFEKNKGECTGELKGEAVIQNATTAEYQADGDPCVLKFIFSKSSVTLKEVEGCGSRRELQCSFDGSYPKKKTARPTSK
jgi:hypothetical protein